MFTALTLLFSGCTAVKTPEVIEVNRNFRAQAIITHNSAAYTADFETNENGCSAAFVLPEEISELSIYFDGNNFTYKLGELSFNSPPKNEINHFLPLIYSVLTDNNGTLNKEEMHYSVQGTVQNNIYYMNIDKHALIPTYIEIESSDLTVRFENAHINEQNTE